MVGDLIHYAEFDYRLSLAELSRCCEVSAEKILFWVSEGVLEPSGGRERDWRFDSADLERARCALRLERDLGLNAAGIALTLQLLDESRRLQARVSLLETLLNDR
jgi:chaperone modulatory protein CbpM